MSLMKTPYPHAEVAGACLRAAQIDREVPLLRRKADDDENSTDIIEQMLEETSFKWNLNKEEAHFNGPVTSYTVDSARKMVASFEKADVDRVTLYINSYGGTAAAGVALYNLLNNSKVSFDTVSIGLAYSAATLIWMAGDRRMIATGAQVGVHCAQGFALGDATAMLDEAAVLEKLDRSQMEIYAAKVPEKNMKQVEEAVYADTSFNSEEAMAIGFATDDAPKMAKPERRMEKHPVKQPPGNYPPRKMEEVEKPVIEEKPERQLVSLAHRGLLANFHQAEKTA